MSLVKYNQRPSFTTFDKFVDDFFNRSIGQFVGSDSLMSQPSVNVKETDNDFTVELAAPGLQKSDFNINIEDDFLTISAERNQEDEVKEEKFTRREFNYTAFRRQFRLPETVKAEAIEATYENGVLNITLPKKEEAKPQPARAIEIQ